MSKHRGSIFWSLILIGIGILFLLNNIIPEFRPWRLLARFWSSGWFLFARFWPVIIILWGVKKLVSYFSPEENPEARRKSVLSGGDVVLLIFLLIVGTAASGVTKGLTHGTWKWSPDEIGIHIDDGDFGWFDSRKSFEFTEEVTQPLKGGSLSLEISNKFGGVNVLVHEHSEIKVKLVKKVKADDEATARAVAEALKIKLETKTQGSGPGYSLSSNRESLDKDLRKGLQTDFFVWVPKSTKLNISNKYGPISVDGASGDHEITNAYGPVVVKSVDGSVRVENSYGPINLDGITGNCQIVNKFGPVQVETIGGSMKVENGYGPVDLSKIRGPVSLSNRYGPVQCDNLESSLSFDGQHANVKAMNVNGDVEITTSYENVELENVQGGIKVHGKHGDIDIKASHSPVKPIFVEAEYSGVSLSLPKESRFELDAISKYGKFVSGFESINVKDQDLGKNSRIKASNGQGGPMIIINTSYRDITLNPS